VSVVTAVELDGRSGGVRVQVDGTPFATVAPGDVSALGLVEGRAVDDALRASLEERAELFGAREVALRMLAARPLPAREVLRRLLRKGHARHAADVAVAALTDAGLIDDADFARHYARTRSRQKRVGPARLVAELRRLGVEEQAAAAAVAEALTADGFDALAVLREAAARKLRSLGTASPQERARRLQAYLRRRGFASADVIAVVREACRA
jgi:regulatory protein